MKNNTILLDGKLYSNKIKDEVKNIADSFKHTPILSIITIGDNELNEKYVEIKRKALEEVGMSLLHLRFKNGTPENKIIKKIKELNKDASINGIVVELPISDEYDENKIINTICEEKDVDALTYTNNGKLLKGQDAFLPCTVSGIIKLLEYYNIDFIDKHVVIVGNDKLVTMGLVSVLSKRNACVTICDCNDKNLSNITKEADILIVTKGKKNIINNKMIKECAIIIDMGIANESGKVESLVNPNVKNKASYLTPVIGGIGPMSVAMLLKNTMDAYLKQIIVEKKGPIN